MNGLYSPIDQLLMIAGGIQAVVEQPYAGDVKSYDPASPDDYVPGLAQSYPVVAIWSVGEDAGLEQSETAAVLVSSKDLPAGQPRAMQASVTLRSPETGVVITYRVVRVARRVYLGRTDGYNLFLAA